ncbi:MAG: hypothetical protein C5B49_14580 [Bdellovibrio sp.]|nr:MAG: hypothetical protein C5B49_14580 [Bdellovibrio sp.]
MQGNLAILILNLSFVIFTFFFSALASGRPNSDNNNHHDHLFMIPAAGLFAPVISNNSHSQQKVGEAISDSHGKPDFESINWFLTEVVRHPPAEHWNLNTVAGLNVVEFLRALLQAGVSIESMLSFPALPPWQPRENRRAYLIFYELRQALYKAADPDQIEQIYSAYFAAAAKRGERITQVSGSLSAFQGDDLKKIERIDSAARLHGVAVKFYGSFQRKRLVEWAASEISPLPNEEQWITKVEGLNLSGSLEEGDRDHHWERLYPPEVFKRGLLKFFAFASKNKLSVAIHAFENRSKGNFYDGLRQALSEFQGDLLIEIAHMASIDADWIQFLSEVNRAGHVRIALQVTLPAYDLLIDNFVAGDLLALVRLVERLGLPVQYGYDGVGTFERTWLYNSPSWPTFLCHQIHGR